SLIQDPPRKLLLSSPVLQVANANTVKDRFLFLFTDILVVAKPMLQDADDTARASPGARRFVVKSVVRLRELRFSADRDDSPAAYQGGAITRHPLVRAFVAQFGKDPDHAITTFLDKSGAGDDPVTLGQLLFRTVDLNRAKLGEYLARRTSKVVLKAYINSFGFEGLRVDKALRAFLQSLHVPSPSKQTGALEYITDAFASRWYDANKNSITYDKDLAVRLVRALVQLDDVLHGGVFASSSPAPRVRSIRNVTTRDFREAFRRFDPRRLVQDDVLDAFYTAIRHEPLAHARPNAAALNIVFKRPVPPRLTYRVQSEPVIVRLPQTDAGLVVHLHGQDLLFDPPTLTFARTPEASFRMTGTSLGPKHVVFARGGTRALEYAGLPLSAPVIVERAFMRNTFQVAFASHAGEKRRYMFSVDDPV
ncbi:Sec7 domain-containing protein, partial [Vararia minispora EC-137]